MSEYKLLGVFLVTAISFFAAPQVVMSESSTKVKSNQFWWPNQLDLSPLRDHDIALIHLVKNLIMQKLSSHSIWMLPRKISTHY